MLRWSWIELDGEALRHNIRLMKERIGPRALMAVVKANAYGHDDVWVARQALQEGASWLAAATPEEALGLRHSGIRAPILLFGAAPAEEAEGLMGADVTVSVVSHAWIEILREAARRAGRHLDVHLMVDTGMGREGVDFREAARSVAAIEAGAPYLAFNGIYTHFATAEGDTAFTRLQISRFRRVLGQMSSLPPWVHAQNSAGILGHPFPEATLARAGIALYGLSPGGTAVRGPDLHPVLALRSRAVHVKTLSPGESVGYGRTWIAKEPTQVVTLPVGYADGLPRSASGRGWVLFHGQRWPIIGRVSMDQTTVGLPADAKVELGDVFTLIGQDGDEAITADEVAEWCGTIGYEITSRLSRRLPRIDAATRMPIS